MKKLPDHPAAGLLWRALQRNRLAWLRWVIPEDFWQECWLFLAGWSPEVVNADPREFSRAAARHFYGVAVAYGFRRPRGSLGYIREAERLEPLEDAEEDSYEKKVAIQNWRSQKEHSGWFQEKLELCRKVLLGSAGSGRTEWYAFQAYLSGCNLNEIAFLAGWKVSECKKRLIEIIRRIREAAGVDPNLPLPPMPKKGKVEFRQGWAVHAGSRPKAGKPRQLAGDPRALANLPLKEIMARFGVSKATASRIRRRGWFVPDYHKRKSGQKEGEK